MKRSKRDVEVIVKMSVPFEQIFKKIEEGNKKRKIGEAIDTILEQTEKCHKVKIIFTNKA